MLYAGEPQSTRVVMRGPFVGESDADISRLDEAYRQGRFPQMSELAPLMDSVVVTTGHRQ
jgi:hypothetical protein